MLNKNNFCALRKINAKNRKQKGKRQQQKL